MGYISRNPDKYSECKECDVLPWRVMNEEAVDLTPKQPTLAHMNTARLGRMLDEYYSLNDWDGNNGFPSSATLRDLGVDSMDDVLGPLRKTASTAPLSRSCACPAERKEVGQ